MKTGKNIKTLYDIKMLVTHLCTTEKKFTKEEIFDLAQKHIEGSALIINKKLKTLINQVVDFLIEKNLLIEKNGEYYQLWYALETETKVCV